MLVITLGDPWSINVEMVARLISEPDTPTCPLVVVGSRWQWEDQCRRLGLATGGADWQFAPSLLAIASRAGRWFVDCRGPARGAEQLSVAERGALAVAALDQLRGFTAPQRLAVLTCPIEKYAARAAGFAFPGQTEFFEDLWQREGVMLLAGPRLKVGLASNHLPLSEVASYLGPELILRKLAALAACLGELYNQPRPRLAVCGLNPHAGEGGLCGREEIDWLGPALATARRELDADIVGPLPADTVFWQAYQGRWDAVLALYHDQGLGPLKTVHFDEAVNISGGLAHLRISPDHGPAREHFLRQSASGRSFEAAWQLARDYLQGTRPGFRAAQSP